MSPSKRATSRLFTEPDPNVPGAVFTVIEFAALMRVNRKSAYAAIARGDVPGIVRVGRRIRVSRTAITAWLDRGGAAAVITTSGSNPTVQR